MTSDFPPGFPYDQPHLAAEEARQQGDLLRAALWDLISTVEATGGVLRNRYGDTAAEADHDWFDLGEVYLQACRAIGREPMVTEAEDDPGDLLRSDEPSP